MLPEQLVALHRLSSLAVPFNRFITLPLVAAQMTHVQVSDVEVVSLAGNSIERLSSNALTELKYAKRLDLRLNELTLPTTDTLKFGVLERLTYLDVRDNHISELDLHVLRSLEYLNCERNSMVSLRLNGTSLRVLAAARNREFLVLLFSCNSYSFIAVVFLQRFIVAYCFAVAYSRFKVCQCGPLRHSGMTEKLQSAN